MRYGIFSDVHANLPALTAVLRSLKTMSIDKYACIGDTVGYGGSPNECCDLIRDLVSNCVLGNHDAAVSGRMEFDYYYDAAREALLQHRKILSPENLKWLSELPYQSRSENVLYCHGSPVDYQEFDYIFSEEQAATCLPIWDELGRVTFIGHSHLCKVFSLTESGKVTEVIGDCIELEENKKYIISVGSVGQPRDYDPRASFTVYDSDKELFTFHRVEYDIDAAAEKIFQLGLEYSFGNRLYVGV